MVIGIKCDHRGEIRSSGATRSDYLITSEEEPFNFREIDHLFSDNSLKMHFNRNSIATECWLIKAYF